MEESENDNIMEESVSEDDDIMEEPLSEDDLQIFRLLGSGAYGKVYLGKILRTNTSVAIKQIPIEKNVSAKREIAILGYATDQGRCHSLIQCLYGSFKTETSYYIITEYINGSDLEGFLKKGPHPIEKIEEIVEHIKEGLQYLHSKSIAHRDIKLENFLTSSQGEVKIIDFGLSCTDALPKVRCTGLSNLGTVIYWGPEHYHPDFKDKFNMDIWIKADVFAFGVLAYELATGKLLNSGLLGSKKNPNSVKAKAIMGQFKHIYVDVSLFESPYLKILIEECLISDPLTRPELSDFQTK